MSLNTTDDDKPPNSGTSVVHRELASSSSTEEMSEIKTVKHNQSEEIPYHVFTRRKKKALVYLVSMAALFSPLSSNIYFPALGSMSRVRSWHDLIFYVKETSMLT
jgi:hypothetical protein